jgi:ribose 5-phosphate isomerase B
LAAIKAEQLKIAIGSDHAGFLYKDRLADELIKGGYNILDLGVHSEKPSDYPDIAEKMAQTITENKAEKGILICGSGIGVSIAANKFKGIRAGVSHDTYSAHQGVEHDDMNVLCIGSRVVGFELLREIVLAFLLAKFSHSERHERRINKIMAFEAEQMK